MVNSSKQKKYYVVWRGIVPGIYKTWKECKKQVDGFSNSVYKSFASLQKAREAYLSWERENYGAGVKREFYPCSLSVDASCSGNPGIMEYRGVDTWTRKEEFHFGPYPNGTNNIGEFLAIVHGLAWLKEKEVNIPIYSDSGVAILWVKRKKCGTKMKFQNLNQILLLIRKAEKWLEENRYTNLILKWDTQKWGEIPADFGRK